MDFEIPQDCLAIQKIVKTFVEKELETLLVPLKNNIECQIVPLKRFHLLETPLKTPFAFRVLGVELHALHKSIVLTCRFASCVTFFLLAET